MIYLGADHAGFKLKEKIKAWLAKQNVSFIDTTPELVEKDDYPDVAKKVATLVKKNKSSKGILVCGSGIGMSMAANRYKGIRAAYVFDKFTAQYSRIDNDANIICLRQRMISWTSELKLVHIFLKTKFSGNPRHKRRVKKLG